MIKKLQHTSKEIATEIRSVFQVSYAVEAKLLKAVDFPPLKRPLESFLNSDNHFFGYIKKNELAAVVEIHHTTKHTHIQSLVVAPKFFRQGIASQLIKFVFDSYDSDIFMVETGVENGPATTLYRKFGFKEVKQWDTDHGVRKVKFERRI
ncbi:N-acetyltransferase [uncultured Kordia sp.]|uniref:GNAT family N-acetyltransferase n=1 Tax=uncultured Kordia sp. TaxID=507699 RepID=UPI002619EE6D|nr:GNAT family N-acetyltransferase [uncultured Kordia sp.]